MKKFLLVTVTVLFIGYLTMAFTVLNKQPEGEICKSVEVVFKKKDIGFLTSDEVKAILKRKKLYPEGKKMNEIVSEEVEKVLNDNPLIEHCVCYKTEQNVFCIQLIEREPILHIFPDGGKDYYIDRKGQMMNNLHYAIYLPIATGHIDKAFAQKDLYNFAKFLQENRFWDAQIEQIHVDANHEIALIPRVGNHVIRMGKLVDAEEKLNRLREFYTKGLNKVGWNKYSTINIEYSNQIICTKNK